MIRYLAMGKRLGIAGVAVIGLLSLVAVALELVVDVDQFRPRVEEAIGRALGRRVSIGRMRVALLAGGIAVDNLVIADDPAFSSAPFVTAKTMTVGIALRPLVLSRTLRIESFRLEEPRIVLQRSDAGSWNFSGLGASAGSRTDEPASGVSLSLRTLALARGRIVVGGRTARRAYDDVTLAIRDLSGSSRFAFRLTAKTAGTGKVAFAGEAGPVNRVNVANTPLRTTFDISHLDVQSTGIVDPTSGVAGVVDFSGALTSDGWMISSRGRMTAAMVQLVPGGSPSRVPFEVDYETDYDAKTHLASLRNGTVHLGKAVAHLTGDCEAAGDTARLRMTFSGEQMPLTEFDAAMPAIGFTLPSGASLRRGTIDAEFAISGRIDRLAVAGPVRLSNAAVAGFDLGARLGTMASFAGVARNPRNETIIQTLDATLHVAPDGSRVDGLNLIVPTIGRLTGAGTIAPDGTMDFVMLARPTGSGAVGLVTGGFVRITSLGKGIPFRIRGTTVNPDFGPDVGRAVGNVIRSPGTATKAAGGAIGGLFHTKKP